MGVLTDLIRGTRAALQPEVEGGLGPRLAAFKNPQIVEDIEQRNRLREQFAAEFAALEAAQQTGDTQAIRNATIPLQLALAQKAPGVADSMLAPYRETALRQDLIQPGAMTTPQSGASLLSAFAFNQPDKLPDVVPAVGQTYERFAGAGKNAAQEGLYNAQTSRVDTLTPYEQQRLQAQAMQAQAAAGLSNVKAGAGGFAPRADSSGGGATGAPPKVKYSDVNTVMNRLRSRMESDLTLTPNDVSVELGDVNRVRQAVGQPLVAVVPGPDNVLRLVLASEVGIEPTPPAAPPAESGGGFRATLQSLFNPQGPALEQRHAAIKQRGENITGALSSLMQPPAQATGPIPAVTPPPAPRPQPTGPPQPPPRSWTPSPTPPPSPTPSPPMAPPQTQPTPPAQPAGPQIPKLPPQLHDRLMRGQDVDANEIVAAYMAMGMPEAEAKAATRALAATLGE